MVRWRLPTCFLSFRFCVCVWIFKGRKEGLLFRLEVVIDWDVGELLNSVRMMRGSFQFDLSFPQLSLEWKLAVVTLQMKGKTTSKTRHKIGDLKSWARCAIDE